MHHAGEPKKGGKKSKASSPSKKDVIDEGDVDVDILREAADRAAAAKAGAERDDAESEERAAAGLPPRQAADAVLGFQATPLISRPPPDKEELGDPDKAQEKAAAKRRQEAELEAQQREPHQGGTIMARHGTGTTPYSHRLQHRVSSKPLLRIAAIRSA